jgi:hypothetical protein
MNLSVFMLRCLNEPYNCNVGHYNDVTPLQYRTFKFGSCEAADGSEEVQHPDQIAAGKIRVTWYNARESTHSKGSTLRYVSSGLSANQEQKKLPEGKKWFMAPGLQTEGGAVKTSSSGFAKISHVEVSCYIHLPANPKCLACVLIMGMLRACHYTSP